MKRTALFVVIVVVSVVAFVCADVEKPAGLIAGVSAQKSAQTVPTVPGPNITFESAVHNFGDTNPGSVLNCEFKFTNTGDSLLEVKDVQSTCGCTVPELKKRQYAPGESGVINVVFSPGSAIGLVVKQLHVLSNDKKQPELTLTLRANVIRKVVIKPEPISLSLKKPNAGCPEITLTSIDGKAFAITKFQSSPNCMRLDFDPNYQSTVFVLKPIIDVERLKKFLRGTIYVTLNHPECKEVSALFDAPALYKATPPTLLLLNAEPLKPIIRDKVWLLSNYNEDFEIESTSSQNGFIKVASSEKAGPGRYMFSLQITPPKLADTSTTAVKSFTDLFTVKIKGGEKVEISCRGYYTRQKTASAKP